MRTDKLTQKSMEAIQASQEIARGRNHNRLEPAHLALALLDQEESLAAILLERAGPDPGTVPGLEDIVERIPFEGFPEEPLRVELEGFRDAALGRSDPVVSGDEGRAALEITLCIEKRILDHVAHSRTS